MSVFTMVAIIVVTSILAKAFVSVRTSGDPDEIQRLRLENQQLHRRVERLESLAQEGLLLEDLSGDRALMDEIDRAAGSDGADGTVGEGYPPPTSRSRIA